MNLFDINFNNNENKFSSLAYGCRNDVTVLDKLDYLSLVQKTSFCRWSTHFNVSV